MIRCGTLSVCLTVLLLTGCEASPPIELASESKSHFESAVYKGQTAAIDKGTPGNPQYRVFSEGATGFVSISSVRKDAETRADAFCGRKGKIMNSLAETVATPPYILGNFPRIEIIFECIQKPNTP
jgi:hypothetical protein